MSAIKVKHRSGSLSLLGVLLLSFLGCQRKPESQTASNSAPGADRSATPAAAAIPQSQTPSISAPPAAAQGRKPATLTKSVTGNDESLADYGQVLAEVVDDDGLVRYQLLREPSTTAAIAIDRARDNLSQPASPPDEKSLKAELINAFNLTVMSLVAAQQRQNPELKSVQDIPGFFDTTAFPLRGQSHTLRGLEDKLAAMGDPRVFAALVRASMSCPPLRREPYLTLRLDQQLDDQCRLWLDDRSKNRTLQRSIGVSEIFKWRQDEFNAEPYDGPVGFLKKFSRPRGAIRDFITGMKGEVKITYLPYDWRLNRAPDDDDLHATPSVNLDADSAAASQPNDE